jgi:hypothetical protein
MHYKHHIANGIKFNTVLRLPHKGLQFSKNNHLHNLTHSSNSLMRSLHNMNISGSGTVARKEIGEGIKRKTTHKKQYKPLKINF